ncbi:SdpI family protein [Cellulomonas hominis]|uniref:SdpI family protein n=1 Tax=Cellulomonas hominis TaxID=156981 RepID=A0A7Z8K238_9CELL|nr:SdpI family protein [Cellulomonas hominis]TKR27350.1 SdpI family protein [Cellulomonas hominis]
MTSPGWFAAVGCAVLLGVLDVVIWAVVSAAGGAGRSRSAGIRLPSLMASEEAWRAGHAAARKVMGPLLVAAAVIAVLSVPLQLSPIAYVVTLGLSLACTVLALGAGAAAASRVARQRADD